MVTVQHFNRLCPRPPVTARSFSLPRDPRLPSSGRLVQILHTTVTSILAYANRDGILTRLVASFPLLFITSDDVLCSKFGGV